MSTNENISKSDKIAKAQANLPLPNQPPVASDWNSADASININSGAPKGDISTGGGKSNMREPVVNDENLQNVGRTGHDNLSGIPSDAVTADKRNAAGTVDTMNPGYKKND